MRKKLLFIVIMMAIMCSSTAFAHRNQGVHKQEKILTQDKPKLEVHPIQLLLLY